MRKIGIPRGVTFLLLILTTVAILAITLQVSGKSYKKVEVEPFHDVKLLIERVEQGNLPFSTFVALLMPVVFNVILFVPWGFLLFVLLDTESRSVFESYVYVLLLATAMSGLVEATQYFSTTRVTDVNDLIWNVSGAILGAVGGHVRRRVRFEFA